MIKYFYGIIAFFGAVTFTAFNNTENISNEIEKLSSSFNSAVTSGDFYEFIYLPEIGIHVIKNNEQVELITGFDFKKAFFGIFLSDNPIQKNLKKAMLGG